MGLRHLAFLLLVAVGGASCREAVDGAAGGARAEVEDGASPGEVGDAGDDVEVGRPGDAVVGLGDADCDGLADDEEAALGTRADAADSDGDGLADGLEVGRVEAIDPGCAGFVPDADPATKTDPTRADTDGDGVGDGVEDRDRDGRQDPDETAPDASDTDCDGLDDATELATRYPGLRRTDPTNPDSDGDGIVDGVEAGVLAPVATLTCASVPRDGDRGSTTDPTSSDSDRDGLADGCEDRNRDGVADLDESDPQAFDTDGDGLGDGVEDADHDCLVDAGETDPVRADSDGDGLGDGLERAAGTTDATSADSDGDGLADGTEDRDRDGVVDVDETDPTAADSDGDGLDDGDEDRDHDGMIEDGETDPRTTDTDGDGFDDGRDPFPATADADGDGLADRVEDVDGDGLVDDDETDPLAADSDGDGVLDGLEVLAGAGPLAPDDPAPDVAAGLAATCTASGPGGVALRVDRPGDWTLALGDAVDYDEVAIVGARAATFDDDAADLAGFVLARAAPPGDVVAQADALFASLGALGAVTVVSAGRTATSPEGDAGVFDIHLGLELASARRRGAVRGDVLAVLAGVDVADLGGLPGASGPASTGWVIRLALAQRDGGRLVVLGGVERADDYVGDARLGLDLLATGSGLARAGAGTGPGCAPFTVSGAAMVDFIWMADISVSTDNDRGRIATAAGSIFERLALSGVDFRMGVVPSTENRVVDSHPGDLRSGFTRDRDQFEADLRDTSASWDAEEGCEYGLTAMDDAIARALPRTADESATRLREGARLVAFYISDETAQELESSYWCGEPRYATGQSDGARKLPPNGLERHHIQALVAPFIERIRGEGGVAFGQVLPVKAPFCIEGESGLGYVDVIEALGGSHYRTCDADPGFVLDDMLDTIAARAANLFLPDAPIAATLQVGVTRAGATETTLVPMSDDDGFAYEPRSNAIFFRGDRYRPHLGDRVTVAYRRYIAAPAPVTCEAPRVPDATGLRCVCAAGVASSSASAADGAGACAACGPREVCDELGDACGCRCPLDCGGALGRHFECAPDVCAPVCGDADDDGTPDCNGRCATNFGCDAACICACLDREPGGAHDCNGLVTPESHLVCDVARCLARCPLDCGGCGEGERCDLATCACVP